MQTIRIDDDVYSWLQAQGKAFEDTPNSVLRKIAGLDEGEPVSAPVVAVRRGKKTPQRAYRTPIIEALKKHGGQAARKVILDDVEKSMAATLNPFDKEDIKSGTPRWQKTAEYEVFVMRNAGILKPVDATPSGYWALSDKGKAASV